MKEYILDTFKIGMSEKEAEKYFSKEIKKMNIIERKIYLKNERKYLKFFKILLKRNRKFIIKIREYFEYEISNLFKKEQKILKKEIININKFNFKFKNMHLKNRKYLEIFLKISYRDAFGYQGMYTIYFPKDKIYINAITDYQFIIIFINNNKEEIINNNHNHDHNNINNNNIYGDLKKIKQWFMTNKIDFSKKHEAKVLELLKNNSLGFILKTFQNQLDILKNKSDVKNVAAVFSNHLFKGTTEVNTKEIEMREAEQEKIKNEERKEYTDNDKVIEVFKNLPAEQQLEIENEVIEKMNNPMLRDIKRNAESVFYLMISKELKEKMFKLGIKF